MTEGRTPLVVHIVHRLDYGGLENGVVNLINRMPVSRYRHAVLCLSGYSAEFRNRLASADVEVLSVDKRPGKDLLAYGRVWRTLRHLRPAIVHTRNLGTIDMQWIAAAAGVAGRVHGEHGWEAADPTGRSIRARRIRRACRPVIQRYIAMSKDLAHWVETQIGVPTDRLVQIYNGVDTDRFRPDGASVELPWARAPSNTNLDAGAAQACVIGTVGRLDPIKNQMALVDAFCRLRDRDALLRRRLRLVIAGDGPERAALAAAIAERGVNDCVWLAGARPDVAELMRSFDVFVLPSVNEGISNTILEAMATQLPIVAARVGGNPELIVAGVTGEMYAANDPDDLDRTLVNYVTDTDLRRAQGAAGRERAVSHFRLESMVQRYSEVYDACLEA